MATEGDRQENIEVPPQVALDFGHEGNQNDHKCKEKLFESSQMCLESPIYSWKVCNYLTMIIF